jgi:hypothetical protein
MEAGSLQIGIAVSAVLSSVTQNVLGEECCGLSPIVMSMYFRVTSSFDTHTVHYSVDSGFGGLVVSMLASGTQDRGYEPGRSRRIFQGKKIHSVPSFGGEVKPSVPCRRFAACERTLRFTWKSESQAKLIGHFSPYFRPLTEVSHVA